MPSSTNQDEPDSNTEDAVFSISEDFVQSPSHKAAATGSLDFDGLLHSYSLRLREDLSEGNGGQAWPAGMVLAKYLLRKKREELKSRSIVELGAGGGLVGLAIAVGCSPSKVVNITDQAAMVPLMQENIALNNLQHSVAACAYGWGGARPESVPAAPDVVLAADCVYFEPAFPLLQRTLEDLIGPETTCYFCFKRRRRADMHFVKAVKKTFLVEDVTDDPDRDAYARDNIFLCTIKKKASDSGHK